MKAVIRTQFGNVEPKDTAELESATKFLEAVGIDFDLDYRNEPTDEQLRAMFD